MHPSGTVYAMAQHRSGVLNGLSIALYENHDPMTYATYAEGKRHGLLKTWSESSQPVLFSLYVKGKRQGFSCFFNAGEPRMILEYDHDVPKTIQLVSGLAVLKTYSGRSEADADQAAKASLEQLDEIDAKMKVNESAFKKQISADAERQRKMLATRLGPIKRDVIQIRENQRSSQEDAFFRQVRRMGGL